MNHKVHNLQAKTRRVSSKYSSWIDYWEKATKLEATICHNVDCNATVQTANIDGAHIQRDTLKDRHWWIVPLCHKCNTQFGKKLTVSGPLVRVTNPKVTLK